MAGSGRTAVKDGFKNVPRMSQGNKGRTGGGKSGKRRVVCHTKKIF